MAKVLWRPVLVFLGSLILVLFYPIEFFYEEAKDYLEVLLTVSGVVFTIMGIWLAFIYPNAMIKLTNPGSVESVDFTEALSDTRRLEYIVGCVISSIVVVAVVMSIFFLKMIFGNSALYAENKGDIKAVCMALIFSITYVQFLSLLQVVAANIGFLSDLHSKARKIRLDNDV